MAKHKKPAPAPKAKTKSKAAPAKAKPPVKKSPSKPSVKPSSSKSSKPAAKPAAKAPAPAAKPAKAAPAPAAPAAKAKPAESKSRARDLLRNRILGKAKPARPIAFSLDEVREIAKTVVEKAEPAEAGAKPAKAKIAAALEMAKPAKPHHVKAASLADILGFNPKQAGRSPANDEANIPEKFRRYYKLLIELRNHVTGQLDQHTEETLKRSSKEDSGDLSSYGQHMADAGTDTFDRDFALSLVSNEQEALSEIEAAIQRIKQGTYGVCEITQQPISKERLMAVPFTRYTAEAQKELERNRHRARTQAGLFGELGEEGAKISDDSDDE
jgi:RNA polymerase-binding transcription factor DksA